MKALVTIGCVFLALSVAGQSPESVGPTNGTSSYEIVKQHSDYLRSLDEANARHHEFLWSRIKDVATFLGWCVGSLVVMASATLAFIGVRSSVELKKATSGLAAGHAEKIEDAVNRLRDEARRKIESEVAEHVRWAKEENTRQSDALRSEFRQGLDSMANDIAVDADIKKLVKDAGDAIRTPKGDPSYATTLLAMERELVLALRDKHPGELRLVHMLGMILFRRRKTDEAIWWLRNSLGRGDRGDNPPPGSPAEAKRMERIADIHFNLACYLNAKADRMKDPSKAKEKERLKEESLAELDRSCALWEGNIDLAKVDSHLKTLIATREWKGRQWLPISP